MTGQGVSSRSSHSAAAGRTTFSANPCTQSRMSRWSSESSSEKGVRCWGGLRSGTSGGEVRWRLEDTQDDGLAPLAQLRATSEAYADFCLEYPAFLDCALSLMRRRARELYESVSDAVWFRLGLGMAGCLGILSRNLAAGVREGVFPIDDVDFTANHLYTQLLGTM